MADELELLRASVAKLTQENASLRRTAEQERERRETALEELAQVQLETQAAGIAGSAVYGRPALAEARRVKRDLTDVIVDLADFTAANGFGSTAIKAASDVLDDLALLGVAPVRGEVQSRRRDFTRRVFTHPGLLGVLGKPLPGRTYFAKFVLEQAAQSYSEPGFRRVFEKASERYDDSPKRR